MTDDIEQLRAELEELKSWASDACELLHEIRGADEMAYDLAIDALLRRMENP